MLDRKRGLVALALAGALVAGGFVATGALAKGSRTTSRSDSRSGGFLGVNLQDLSEGLADSYDYDGNGVVVSSVVDGSPADKAGIKEGDIITRFDGNAVNSADQLTRRVRALSPGTLADVTVWRDGKTRNLGRVEIGDLADRPDEGARSYSWRSDDNDDEDAPPPPDTPRAPRAPREMRGTPHVYNWNDGDMPGLEALRGIGMGRGRLGVETRDLDSDLGGYFDQPDGKGVLVLRVLEDTPAARAGLRAGDVILSVDGDDTEDSDALRKELRGKDAGDVELRIRRKGEERTIHATLEKSDEGEWMGMLDGNGRNGRRVFRMRSGDGGHMWMGDGDDMHMEGMSPEDKAQLKRDLEQLRKDLKEMRKDRRNDDRKDRDNGDDEDD